MKARGPIPVNLISGPLGVGKTTTINHLMRQKPPHEKWAILVNEYGLVGLDAALMEPSADEGGAKGVEIKEVAGGCICCSAGLMFEVSLVMLLRRKPDRLLIEPTGLAALSGILDTLDRPGIRESVDVRSVICLLDPSRFRQDLQREEVRDQVEAADVLLGGRADLVTAEALDDFTQWAHAIFPPKTQIAPAIQGRIPIEVLDAVAHRSHAVRRGGHTHGTDHHHDGENAHVHEPHGHGHSEDEHEHHHAHAHGHDAHAHHDHAHEASPSEPTPEELILDEETPIVERSHRSDVASTVGWICWHALIFDADKVTGWLNEIGQLPGVRRTKAVMRTHQGWFGFNIADGVQEIRSTGYRRDSRLEIIIEDGEYPDTRALEERLRACLFESPE